MWQDMFCAVFFILRCGLPCLSTQKTLLPRFWVAILSVVKRSSEDRTLLPCECVCGHLVWCHESMMCIGVTKICCLVTSFVFRRPFCTMFLEIVFLETLLSLSKRNFMRDCFLKCNGTRFS